ncbi:MAG: carbohydrate ABC transporter permease [Ktedonobacteraceae bacterium]
MATIANKRTAAPAPPRKSRERTSWSAWLWIAPSVILLVIFFIYPLIDTLILSFEKTDELGDVIGFVGLNNYQVIFTDPTMLDVLKNNLIWLILATLLTVGLGLIIAVLVDRVKIEAMVKSMLFIPMAISAVAAGIIWRFVYIYEPKGQTQIGLLNAFAGLFKINPQAWIENPTFSTYALIVVYVWIWTGFCMVILSAALKGVPEEIIEAAKMDGAGRLVMFWRITVPSIAPTLGVVITTMLINILKIFDIVYLMTGGNYGTNVVAMAFYQKDFLDLQEGIGSALAILLTVLILPVMVINIQRMRAQERIR